MNPNDVIRIKEYLCSYSKNVFFNISVINPENRMKLSVDMSPITIVYK